MTNNIVASLVRCTGGLVLLSCLSLLCPATDSVAVAAEGEEKIVINLANHSLSLYKGAQKVRLYPVALGTVSTPTPTGYYKVSEKEVNPTWTDPVSGRSIPSGPDCPLGYRWMGLFGNYGIHGTNRPDSIGHYVSNGCIRMFEKDAEALYDLVKVGTPVEITYNRIVVEKVDDGTVVYYIYPDGYRRQALDVSMVRQWLTGYGVNDFESDEAILEKIKASDGQPTFIGKPYGVTVNGQSIETKAVKVEGVMFVPAVDVAKALNMDLKWSPEEGMLRTEYGNAVGVDRNNRLYANADDLTTLFHLDGNVTASNQYTLQNIAVNNTAPARTETVRPTTPAPQPPARESTNTIDVTVGTKVDVTVPPPKKPQPENNLPVVNPAPPQPKPPAEQIVPVAREAAELKDPAPATEIKQEEVRSEHKEATPPPVSVQPEENVGTAQKPDKTVTPRDENKKVIRPDGRQEVTPPPAPNAYRRAEV